MQNSAPPDPADIGAIFQLFNEIGIINQLSSTLFQARLAPGLTVLHFSILNHLVRVGDGPTPLRLSRAFQVPKTTMSHTLKGLVQRGFVRLDPSAEDGRAKCVFLTPQGRVYREEAIAALAPDIVTLLPKFPAERAHEALPHLEALRKILDDMRT